MSHAVLTSSVDHGWQTPESYLELVRKVGRILYDPCTVSSNPTRADFFVPHDHGHDGLVCEWADYVDALHRQGYAGLVFCNPPYGSSLGAWVSKVVTQRLEIEIVLLVPARTDTKWYRQAFQEADCTLLHSKRIQFLDAATGKPRMTQDKKTGKWTKNSAAFPSVTFYYGPNVARFKEAFKDQGTFVRVDD